jgi:hypothetical protein
MADALPFITTREAAALARVSPKRLRSLMAAGTLIEGVHYTRPRGLRPRFKREALLAWLDGSDSDRRRDGVAGDQSTRPRCKLDKSLL